MLAILFAACDKDVEPKCMEFRNALTAKNEQEILNLVNQQITQSLLMVNSRQNFDALAKYIDEQCKLEVVSTCFECIDTNPMISEITIRFFDATGFSTISIDFWGDPQDNRMEAINVH